MASGENSSNSRGIIYILYLTWTFLIMSNHLLEEIINISNAEVKKWGEKSGTPHIFYFFLMCGKSLTLWFFHSFLLILVLAPQFYPRCIASKERKTERESESWLKRHLWWVGIKKPNQTKHWESVVSKEGCIVIFTCSCDFTESIKLFLVKLDHSCYGNITTHPQTGPKSWRATVGEKKT